MRTIAESNQRAKDMCANGYRYLYGGKGQDYTTGLVNSLHSMYPSHVPLEEALKDADKGYKAIDCSGFLCDVLGIGNMGSAQIRSTAVKRLSVSKANAREGMAIWKSGHVAYVGEGLKIYEASSTKTDMRVSSWEERAGAFTELLIVKGSALAESDDPAKGANPYPIPTRTIKYVAGNTMKGDDVRWVQLELVEAGYNIEIDGSFGPASNEALLAFQASCKISVDGKCGPDTRQHLIANGPVGMAVVNPYPMPTRTIYYVPGGTMKGDDVRWVQFALVQSGASIEIDGSFGPASNKALLAYQEANGLEVDGRCGPATRQSLQDNSVATSQTYTVQGGDTLWGIAESLLGNGSRYGEIMALSGISSTDIVVGQVLTVPAA